MLNKVVLNVLELNELVKTVLELNIVVKCKLLNGTIDEIYIRGF